MRARRLILLVSLIVLSACNRAERSSEGFGQPSEPVSNDPNPVWRGIYDREGQRNTFRNCLAIPEWGVTTNDSLLELLDATVDWHAARPSTRIFVQVRGDTLPRGTDSVFTLRVTSVDSTRAPDEGECAARRPEQPPSADRAKLEAAVRRAVGADSAGVTAATMRIASVWLNRDWRADALVLLRGDRFCDVQGCTMLVFSGTADRGYELLSRVAQVLPPIIVRPEETSGWRAMVVKWNGGAFGIKTAVLRYNNGRYPAMAPTQPQPAQGAVPDSGIAIP